MKTDWRKYEITEDDAEQIGGYVVYTTEADVEAAGKKANFDLGDGIYSDINVARMRARDLSGDYPYHVSTYATWVKGMADDIDQKESDIIAEMREMIALGWEKREAYDKYDEFIDRLNGDDNLTEGLTKDEILTVWENANAAQAEEIADDAIRYWLETDANFDQYQADEEARKWALHKVVGDKDEVILSLAYSETPGFEGDKEQEPLDTSWKALDKYIEGELGFLPEYEVN